MKTMHLRVYFSGKLIVVETNLAWALPYWTRRKQLDDRITFTEELKGGVNI
jgi:hypothetical protein